MTAAPMTIRPYRLFGATEQQASLRQVGARLSTWASDWMVPRDIEPLVEIVPIASVPTNEMYWELAGAGETPFVAVGYGRTLSWQIPGLLFGDNLETSKQVADNSVLDALACRMVRDLAERLLVASGVPNPKSPHFWSGIPPVDMDKPGIACLAMKCSLKAGITISLLLWSETIDAWANDIETHTGKPVVPVTRAIDRERVDVDIVVGEGELTIEELGTLAVGDVIPLGRKLSEEVAVRLATGAPLCKGFLGDMDGRMAVQVTSKKSV